MKAANASVSERMCSQNVKITVVSVRSYIQMQSHLGTITSLSSCFCQDLVTRHLAEKSAAEDQLPPLGPVAWASGSQFELTPFDSPATSDSVRNTLLLPSMASSHI